MGLCTMALTVWPMFLLGRGISVPGPIFPPGGLCPEGLCPGGLCPGGLCPRGSLSKRVSVRGGFYQGETPERVPRMVNVLPRMYCLVTNVVFRKDTCNNDVAT